jgi:hypothetical protein
MYNRRNLKLKIAETIGSAPILNKHHANIKNDMSDLMIVGGSNCNNNNNNNNNFNSVYSTDNTMSNTFFEKLFLNRSEKNTTPQFFSTKHRLTFNNSKQIKTDSNSTSSSRQQKRHPNIKIKTIVAERTNIHSHNNTTTTSNNNSSSVNFTNSTTINNNND